MAPIHDSDIAERRWKEAEWRHYELWEKVEKRLRRIRRRWVILTFIIFLLLSSIPILMDRWPKWRSLSAARQVSQEIVTLMRQAAVEQVSYQIKFVNDLTLAYEVQQLSHCQSTEPGKVVRSGQFLDEIEGLTLLGPEHAELGVPGLARTFCYDAMRGTDLTHGVNGAIVLGLIPFKDLGEKRVDRVSLILIEGPSAKITFE